MATIAEKVFDLLQDMPEKEAGEVLDFTEFLRQRRQGAKDDTALESLIGCLKDSPVFAGRDPLDIQRDIRQEWER
jgi:hypothetical protein